MPFYYENRGALATLMLRPESITVRGWFSLFPQLGKISVASSASPPSRPGGCQQRFPATTRTADDGLTPKITKECRITRSLRSHSLEKASSRCHFISPCRRTVTSSSPAVKTIITGGPGNAVSTYLQHLHTLCVSTLTNFVD